jgi:hypothetical protein
MLGILESSFVTKIDYEKFDILDVVRSESDVSREHITSIFRVEI